MPLKIGAGDVDLIHEHATEAYPEECAGALVGMDSGGVRVVVEVWRAENTHEEERSRRFLIEPLAVKKFEEWAEEKGMGLLGFYHSHVIASVSGENVEDMRSWTLKGDRSGYDEEPIVG